MNSATLLIEAVIYRPKRTSCRGDNNAASKALRPAMEGCGPRSNNFASRPSFAKCRSARLLKSADSR
jgi:hypothetical protein